MKFPLTSFYVDNVEEAWMFPRDGFFMIGKTKFVLIAYHPDLSLFKNFLLMFYPLYGIESKSLGTHSVPGTSGIAPRDYPKKRGRGKI